MLATVGAVLPGTAAGAKVTRPSCAKNPDVCTLAGAAKRSGIWAGVAMNAYPPDPTKATVAKNFNSITVANAMKWDSIHNADGTFNFVPADDEVNWANANGLRVRGHTLLFHRPTSFSSPRIRAEIEAAADPQAKARQLIQEHISTVVSHFRGRVASWDVINEPLAILTDSMNIKGCAWGNGWDVSDGCVFTKKNFFYTTLGEGYIEEALRTARAADPNAELFINELLWNPKLGDQKADALLALVKRLKDKGVPLDGIGLELHGSLGVSEPQFPGTMKELTKDSETMAGLVRYIGALGKLGVRVEFTELDISIAAVNSTLWPVVKRNLTEAEALVEQAKIYGRVGRSCAAAPACSGVTVWGLTDPETWNAGLRSWREMRPLLFDDAFQPKAGYTKMLNGLLQRCPLSGTQPTPCSIPASSPPKPTVGWSVSKATTTVTARFTASSSATGYSITARSGSKLVQQPCPVTAAPAVTVCPVKLSAGRWSVSVIPSNLWSQGAPATTNASL